MQTWLNFWIFLFWSSFLIFALNYFNFILMLLFSEFLWLVLYCLVTFLASKNDSILDLTLTFLFLGLAGLEFAIGLLILILFKNLNTEVTFNNNLDSYSNKSIKKKNFFFFENILV